MKIYNFTGEYAKERGCVMVLGSFDGLHRAHQRIIAEGFDIAESLKLPLVVWALHIPRGNKLMSVEDKISMLERLGADCVIAEELDEIRSFDCKKFVDILANEYGAKHLVCGYNFTFGEFKSGDVDTLKSLCAPLGIQVSAVSKVAIDDITVSSTAVRNALTSGNPVLARILLGRFYEINGIVEHGQERGRSLGFPTANLSINSGMIVPRFGVYRSFVDHNSQRYMAVTNIGVCPSVKLGDEKITVETHLLDKEIDLYGERISVKLASFLRCEKKFESVEALKAAIKNDIQTAKKEFESK
ncbi:MAG: riboflavin biosynthesis protein RibF [Clostridia bacterium]|nr:riboflavin biosynthesis protein RibF [Clostridia bacterium]